MVLLVKNYIKFLKSDFKKKGFESLHDRRWFRKLCFYYKIRHNMCQPYLKELLPIMKTSCYSLHLNRAPIVPNFRNERFKSTFSPPALPLEPT